MKPLCWQIVPALLLVLLGVQPAFSLPTIISSTTSVARNLTLDGEGSASTRIVKVANLELSTADPDGFTLTISSQSLTKSGGETPIPFQVTTVATGSGSPSASDFLVFPGNNYTISTTSAGSSLKEMYIKYTPAALQDPGAYNTSISLIVTDN
ncbi:MAG: hypothetical protein ACYTXT_22075 [Nostoc sp.]|uniref:Spore coat protein U domain-containing protein n=1 Tax=Nostoc punctiforme NIES-2108 TaxID=1356359 RepID=A0A367RS94_NOSPU|nr:hypothetical protein A6769_06240 [Nostoc punctiforme NIES-2108]